MARGRWAQWPLHGSSSDHQMITQTHRRGNRWVSEKVEMSQFSQVPLNTLHSNNSIAFGKSTSQRIYPQQQTPKIG